jgi:hypothetical protein
LAVAIGTLEQHTSHRPALAAATVWTAKSIRPAQSGQVIAAGGLSRESGLQLYQIAGIFLDHDRILHLGVT